MSYSDTQVFRGSCPACGVFQSHEISMCGDAGCLVLHHYGDVECECGEILWRGNR